MRHPPVVMRAMALILTVARTDEQCLSGMAALLRCCYPDKKGVKLDLQHCMASLFDAPLPLSGRPHQVCFRHMFGDKSSSPTRRSMIEFLDHIVTRTLGQCCPGVYLASVVEYFASTAPIVQLSVCKILWTQTHHRFALVWKQRFSEKLLDVLAFYEMMTILTEEEKQKFFGKSVVLFADLSEVEDNDWAAVRKYMCNAAVIPEGIAAAESALSKVGEALVQKYKLYEKLPLDLRVGISGPEALAVQLSKADQGFPNVEVNMLNTEGPVFLRPLPSGDCENLKMLQIAIAWMNGFYRRWQEPDYWDWANEKFSPCDATINYHVLVGLLLQAGLSARNSVGYRMYSEGLTLNARYFLVQYLQLRKSAWCFWVSVGLQAGQKYAGCLESEQQFTVPRRSGISVEPRFSQMVLTVFNPYRLWVALGKFYKWKGGREDYWAGSMRGSGQYRHDAYEPLAGGREFEIMREAYRQLTTGNLVFETTQITVGPLVFSGVNGTPHCILSFGPHTSGYELPGIGQWKLPGSDAAYNDEDTHIMLHSTGDLPALAAWLVVSRGIPISSRATTTGAASTNDSKPAQSLRKRFTEAGVFGSGKENHGLQTYDLNEEAHDRKNNLASQPLLEGGSFMGEVKVILAGRIPLNGYNSRTVAEKKWSAWQLHQASQDAPDGRVEYGHSGLTYPPANKSGRTATIAREYRHSVQLLLVPIDELLSLIRDMKGKVQERKALDASVTARGWTPVKSSDESERNNGLLPREISKLYLRRHEGQ